MPYTTIYKMNTKTKRGKLSALIKIALFITATAGLTLAMIYAKRDGYAHPLHRLLYFTNLSNIWIALSSVSIFIIPYISDGAKASWHRRLYSLKFIFTVSITVTGVVFMTVLAPFARGYNAWTISNVLTHAVTPVLAILDLFVDTDPHLQGKGEIFASTIPPFLYLIFSLILSILKVDFGRGDTYPYFFLNIDSPAGFFGFSPTPPNFMGTFWWILVFLAIVLSIAAALSKLKARFTKTA